MLRRKPTRIEINQSDRDEVDEARKSKKEEKGARKPLFCLVFFFPYCFEGSGALEHLRLNDNNISTRERIGLTK